MLFQAVTLALAGAAAVSAQSPVPQYESVLNITIVPGSVDPNIRSEWCTAQRDTCRNLCSTGTNTNDCIIEDLTIDCTCTSNSSAPGLEYYRATLPSFICEAAFGQCNTQNAGDAEALDDCKDNILTLCPTQDPPTADDIADATTTDASTGTQTTAGPTSQPTSDDEGNGSEEDPSTMTTTDADGFAAPTLAPASNGVAAAAAIGLLAYLV
jgi:hypothetical protein